ncbi:TVP38/TMEM64 family protein [Arenibaculum pallidiluteum]|uniref:TVP38/TMEM64 family protein n=1 Tax=Arenibaculum pallidiluteum TaxID=2812559 RepID=UPI001A95C6F4|nr:VTT domain-containing protein [Arenibaculum pallidiluteum]
MRFVLGVLLAAALLAGLAALWHFTPLSALAEPGRLVDWAERVADLGALGPPVIVALFVLGGCLMFPVLVLIAVTAMALGPVAGFLTALAGCLASAATVFWLGRLSGARLVRRFGGPGVNRASHWFARQGVLAVAVVRIVPTAPFTVVNLVAGASHLRFTHFLAGTAIGMAPGTLAFSLFGTQIGRALRDPRPETLGLVVAAAGAALALGWAAGRLLGSGDIRDGSEERA